MISPFGLMYLRPGNLWTDFVVRRKSIRNILGHPVSDFEAKGEISGILAEASTHESDRMKHRWDQISIHTPARGVTAIFANNHI